jgi:hypothetical protein
MSSRPAIVVAGILAAGLAAGPALAAPSAQRTTLTISTSSTGTSTVAQPVTGTLKAGTKALDGQVVRLVGRMNGATTFRNLGYAKTSASGVVTFSVKPPKGHDVYMLVYNGSHKTSPAYAGSHSRSVTVTVSK